MTPINKKNVFITLGNFLSQFSQKENIKQAKVLYNDLFFDDFINLIELSQSHNGWYTPEQVYFAIESWVAALTEKNLNQWLADYDLKIVEPKTVGLILAGNIPLVGFHDFLSVLISGNKVLVKTSSNDQHLLPFLAKYMITIEPRFSDFITFTEGKLENYDAVIATGSNNTSRYFEYYFKDKPTIIRKSRSNPAKNKIKIAPNATFRSVLVFIYKKFPITIIKEKITDKYLFISLSLKKKNPHASNINGIIIIAALYMFIGV